MRTIMECNKLRKMIIEYIETLQLDELINALNLFAKRIKWGSVDVVYIAKDDAKTICIDPYFFNLEETSKIYFDYFELWRIVKDLINVADLDTLRDLYDSFNN